MLSQATITLRCVLMMAVADVAEKLRGKGIESRYGI